MALFSQPKKEAGATEAEPSKVNMPAEEKSSGSMSIDQLSAEVDKLKAQFSSFYELQKSSTERFTRISEQIGELRAMMIERDKSSQTVEAKATQAIDMVQTVQPDKLMVEIRKIDSKVEALRANIESNENIMANIMNELKDIRNRMAVFKGIDQVMKLTDDVRKDLMSVKATEAVIARHADKVETIFSELQKKFSTFDKIDDTIVDLDKSFKTISSEFDSIKIKITTLSNKKEVEGLITKFNDFEKHAANIIALSDKRFEKLEAELKAKTEERLVKITKVTTGMEELVKKVPDLNKFFDLIDKKSAAVQTAAGEAKPAEEEVNKVAV